MSLSCDIRRSWNWAAWALFSAAAVQSFLGLVGWAMNSYSFGWLDWVFSLSGVFYFGLGFAARRFPLIATLLGVGLYAAFLASQVLQSVAALNSGLVFKIPVAFLLLLAVVAALWCPVAPNEPPVEESAEKIHK